MSTPGAEHFQSAHVERPIDGSGGLKIDQILGEGSDQRLDQLLNLAKDFETKSLASEFIPSPQAIRRKYAMQLEKTGVNLSSSKISKLLF